MATMVKSPPHPKTKVTQEGAKQAHNKKSRLLRQIMLTDISCPEK
jgi:hypothetical protein